MRRHSFYLALMAALLGWMCWSPAFAQGGVSLVINAADAQYSLIGGGYQVTVFLTVLDAEGTPIANLTEGNFAVRQDGDDVGAFQVEPAGGGIHLVLAIDTSGSMAVEGKINAVRQAAELLIEGLERDDQLALISFNEQPKVEINLTTDRTAVQNFVSLLESVRGSGTCLWDSAFEAVELASAAQLGRRAVLLLTDGIDELPTGGVCSTKTLDDVIALAIDPTVRVPVYTLGIGNRVNEQDLTRLAELTGGRASLVEKAADVGDRFNALGLEFGGGYSIRFVSNAPSGEHNLFVQVDSQGTRDQDTRKFVMPELPDQLVFEGLEEGQLIREDLTLSVAVRGEVAPARVELFFDDQLFGEDTEAPFEGVLLIGELDPGAHTLRAVGFAGDGAVIADAEVRVAIEEPVAIPTEVVPSASIAFKDWQAGQTFDGPQTLRASVEGEQFVRRVIFSVDGFSIGEDSVPPFEVQWDTSFLKPGEHALTAIAIGEADQELASSSIQVVYETPLPPWPVLGGSLAVLGLAAGRILLLRRRRAAAARLQETVASPGPAAVRAEKTLAVLTIETCQEPGLIGHRFEIWDDRVLLGRSAACDIVLPVQPVSREHALIALGGSTEGEELTVDDLALPEGGGEQGETASPFVIYDGPPHTAGASTYGTYVDDVSVPLGTGVALRDGSEIRLGRPAAEGRVTPLSLRFHDLRTLPYSGADPDLTTDVISARLGRPLAETETVPLEGAADVSEGVRGRAPLADSSGFEEEAPASYETEDFELIEPEVDEMDTEVMQPGDENEAPED